MTQDPAPACSAHIDLPVHIRKGLLPVTPAPGALTQGALGLLLGRRPQEVEGPQETLAHAQAGLHLLSLLRHEN